MANLYMGRGGIDGMFSSPASGSTPVPQPPIRVFNEGGAPGSPGSTPNPTQNLPSNVLGAQSVRPTGPSQGYDPAYLQNLATSIGGLFSRPQGNLSFNPLGNLSEISPTSGQMGNAPGFGEPSTWLQDALNGIAFMFKPPAPPASNPRPVTNPIGGRGGIGVGRNPVLDSPL